MFALNRNTGRKVTQKWVLARWWVVDWDDGDAELEDSGEEQWHYVDDQGNECHDEDLEFVETLPEGYVE